MQGREVVGSCGGTNFAADRPLRALARFPSMLCQKQGSGGFQPPPAHPTAAGSRRYPHGQRVTASNMKSPRLLVSVRSVEEAESALQGGADLIDIKEPDRGSLGCADCSIIERIVRTVNGRRPVSAAMGELVDHHTGNGELRCIGLTFVKWGLAGCQSVADWRRDLTQAQRQVARVSKGTQLVPVAYADARIAQGPGVDEVVAFACRNRAPALLIDTWNKQAGTNLLDWLSVAELAELRACCHRCGIQLALAGSLNRDAIVQLRAVEPDWFAVRGAACQHGRTSAISAAKVRQLAKLLQPAVIESRQR